MVFKMFVILLTLWMVPLAIGLRRLNKDLSTACADASCLNLDNLDNLTNLTDALNKVDPDDVTDALTKLANALNASTSPDIQDGV